MHPCTRILSYAEPARATNKRRKNWLHVALQQHHLRTYRVARARGKLTSRWYRFETFTARATVGTWIFFCVSSLDGPDPVASFCKSPTMNSNTYLRHNAQTQHNNITHTGFSVCVCVRAFFVFDFLYPLSDMCHIPPLTAAPPIRSQLIFYMACTHIIRVCALYLRTLCVREIERESHRSRNTRIYEHNVIH